MQSATFNNISAAEDPEKATDLPQVTINLYQMFLYQIHFTMGRI
jgi:type IV secretory pathway VirD2 relaxase